MRLPTASDPTTIDVGFIGVPFDIGTSNRPGARLAPREIRDESRMIRPYNMATRAAPFDSMNIADLGDVALNTYNLSRSIEIIETYYDNVISNHCIPLTLGGDHTITLPVLRAETKTHGPLALIHVDAHADCNDQMFGERITHGTWIHRAVDEDILDCTSVLQVGLRGSGYSATDFDWPRQQGFEVVTAEECWYRSLEPLMRRIRSKIGDRPTYITFDIDGIDPAFAPGTGTPEVGGLTSTQALEIVRGCIGLNIVGGDLVEVCPPFDVSRTTSLLAANLLFEMLCVLPNTQYR